MLEKRGIICYNNAQVARKNARVSSLTWDTFCTGCCDSQSHQLACGSLIGAIEQNLLVCANANAFAYLHVC